MELDEVDYLSIHLPHVCIRVAVVDQMDPFDEVAYYSLLPIYTMHAASEWQRVWWRINNLLVTVCPTQPNKHYSWWFQPIHFSRDRGEKNNMFRMPPPRYESRSIHTWYMYLHLPTFAMKINQIYLVVSTHLKILVKIVYFNKYKKHIWNHHLEM